MRGRHILDMTGQRYGSLTIIGRAPDQEHCAGRQAWWDCLCDCGQRIILRGCDIRAGKAAHSCGCGRRRKGSEAADANEGGG